MPYDGLSAYLITDELNKRLIGSKIHKIYQPVKDEIVLYFSDKEKSVLLLCADASFPRAYLISERYDNPSEPPSFCMLLRKYILGAVLKDIYTYEFDRIIMLKLENLSTASELLDMTLILEVMGRYSNLILINNTTNKIIDSMKHVTELKSSVRQVLPGLSYAFPPNEKINPLNPDIPYAEAKLKTMPGKNVSNALLETFTGVSNQLATSFIRENEQYDRALDRLSETEFDSLCIMFCEYVQKSAKSETGYVFCDETGALKDFTGANYAIYNGFTAKEYPSVNQAAEAFYHKRVQKSHISEKYAVAIKKLDALLAKEKNKLSVRHNELSKAENAEEYNIKGNLLLSCLNTIKKGDSSVKTLNYYLEGNPEITIELNPGLTPSQNAQRYFKKYTKARNAKGYLEELILECENEIFYLSSQLTFLKNAANAFEADEIITELIKKKIIKAKKTPVQQTGNKAPKPREYETDEGFVIFVGKNDRQNDRLTFKTALPDDLWMHTKNAHGSHVILKCNNGEYSEKALEAAAKLCVYYSDMRAEKGVAVDYTYAKYVKKPSGFAYGKVIYTDYKTVNVTADEIMFASLKERVK